MTRESHTLIFYMAEFYCIYLPEIGAVLRVSYNASLWINASFSVKLRKWTKQGCYKVTLLKLLLTGTFQSKMLSMPIHAQNLNHFSKHQHSGVDTPNMNVNTASFERLRRQKRTEGLFPWRCILTQTRQTNMQKPRRFSHYQGCRTTPNKGCSKRGVSRASEVLALTTLVTRSAERKGGERQKILYA